MTKQTDLLCVWKGEKGDLCKDILSPAILILEKIPWVFAAEYY